MSEQLIKLLNGQRRHKLLTVALKKKLPDLYAQDGMGDEAIVYVKLFGPWSNCIWYITEYRPEEHQAFGLVYQGTYGDQCPAGELGYICMNELETMHFNGLPLVERDTPFQPTRLGDIRAKLRLRSAA